MKQRILWTGIALFIVGGAIMLIVPMVGNHCTPSWGEDGSEFLYNIGEALQRYAVTHSGKVPSTLALLYPEYIDDERVLEQISLFEEKPMALIYWHPVRLGDADIVVAQLVLEPTVKTTYPWRSFVLWGDGRVRLHKFTMPRERRSAEDLSTFACPVPAS